MRRILAFLALVGMVSGIVGCRHIAGSCDCEHSNYTRGQGCAAEVVPGSASSQPNGGASAHAAKGH